MIIVNMNSGLGNQMFQYALYCRLRKENPAQKIYIDNSVYEAAGMEKKFEIERIFDIKLPKLSDHLSSDSNEYYEKKEKEILDALPHNWLSKGTFLASEYLIPILRKEFSGEWEIYTDLVSLYGKSRKYDMLMFLRRCPVIADIFYKIKPPEKGFNMRIFYQKIHRAFNIDNNRLNDSDYMEALLKVGEKNRIFIGNFESGDTYFLPVLEEIKTAFSFTEISEDRNRAYADKIEKSNSVSIHLRRGDHLLSNDKFFEEGGYYDRAVRKMKEAVLNPVFFLFSDDIAWCKQNLKVLGLTENDAVIFVEGNSGDLSFRDMQLMSLCKNNIIPISTFSWWASYLNENEKKVVIAPEGYWANASFYV